MNNFRMSATLALTATIIVSGCTVTKVRPCCPPGQGAPAGLYRPTGPMIYEVPLQSIPNGNLIDTPLPPPPPGEATRLSPDIRARSVSSVQFDNRQKKNQFD